MLLWTGISRVRVYVMNKSGAAHRVIGDSGGPTRGFPERPSRSRGSALWAMI